MEKSIKSLQRAALDHGAAVVNLRGDAVVALFGVPTALEDATRAAVNTAIDMHNSIAKLRRDYDRPEPNLEHAQDSKSANRVVFIDAAD
jgi:class 3 adenylate cyclase